MKILLEMMENGTMQIHLSLLACLFICFFAQRYLYVYVLHYISCRYDIT